MRVKNAALYMVALLGILLAPSAAWAQSAIAGTVRDTSGAVMPGVTVEASSDALIEKMRTGITDGQGQYRIVDLRPGTYVVTFTLPGFQTVRREGLELPANFTAAVNADLSVGALEESVTVSGASPVVDVQTNVKAQILPRDVLDAVPTARTIQSIGQLVVGVQLSSPDVGGSRAMQQTYFVVHGTGAAQTVVLVDGLMTNGLMGDGSVQAYHNEAMIQEAVYQTAGGTAETLTGGVNMNLVPKEGGNRFTGGAKATKSPSAWQGNNLTGRLADLGVTGVDRISNFYEWNVEQGGPIIQNRLWFFGAFRKARYDKPIANTFFTPEGTPFPVGYQQCRTGAVGCEQGVSDEKMDNPIARLTWQVSPRNKFAAYMDRAMRLRGHAMGSGTDPRTASVEWNTPTFATGSAKWTSTVSPQLMIEGGLAFNRERYDNLYQDGVAAERGTPAWYAGARKNDTSQGTLWNASSAQLGNYPDRYSLSASSSYVTGSHSFKVGFQDSFGPYRRWQNANGDLYQTYNNGEPRTVTVLNTPINSGERLDAAFGIYAQDSWTLRRLTVNVGMRWDYLKQRVTGQEAQAGRFVDTPAYDDIVMPVWKDWSPRTSVVYDIFGTGKTAVRFGFNKFVTAGTMGVARAVNPSGLTSSPALTWVDLNGDDIAQGERGCVFRTPGCEINLAQLPSTFGTLSLASVDPNLERPYQYSTNLGMSHELLPGLALTAEWFRSTFHDMVSRNNIRRTAASYTPVNVVSPLDGRVITAYNVLPQFRQLVENVDTTDPDLQRVYNALEVNINARLPHGIRFFGGTSTERTISNSCSAASTDPNLSLFCDQSESGIPFSTQFKLSGVVPLPWYGITVSGSFQSLPGSTLGNEALPYGVFTWGTGFDQPNGQATYWRVTPTTRYAANCPGPCTPGALVIPDLQVAQLDIPIVPPNTEFTPRVNQVDFAIQKAFRINRFSINPKMDVFNALNSDDYTSVSTMQFGAAAYQRPSVILQGRIIRIGADVKW
jgi:hypothetical protein